MSRIRDLWMPPFKLPENSGRPHLLPSWLPPEAVRTHSRKLITGLSLSEFIQNKARAGAAARRAVH